MMQTAGRIRVTGITDAGWLGTRANLDLRRWRVGAALVAALTFGTLVALVVASAAGAETVSKTFNYTGAEQTFTVPEGVTSLHVVATGAAGGASSQQTCRPIAAGGRGAVVSGNLTVSPGTLYVEVGGAPTPPESRAPCAGGFNGGAPSGGGGGGGGASDVRTTMRSEPNTLASRLLVAAGGGGGGGPCVGGAGGDAGASGGDGQSCGTVGGSGGGAGPKPPVDLPECRASSDHPKRAAWALAAPEVAVEVEVACTAAVVVAAAAPPTMRELGAQGARAVLPSRRRGQVPVSGVRPRSPGWHA